jgi:DNA-binding transcriptional ArsR family regulator
VAASFALLSAPRRLEILRLVWSAELPAGEIHRGVGDVTFGAVSQHLRRLAADGLVRVRAEGRRRLYRARREALGALAPALEALWDDALYRLKLAAELETRRRGPRPRRGPLPRRRSRSTGGLR